MTSVDHDTKRSTERIAREQLARALFTPDAVALVGASADEKKNTARPLRFMRKHGFQGRVFPVNAGRSEVMGLQAYPSVAALPAAIDHAFVMVPGAQVGEALEQSAARGARVVRACGSPGTRRRCPCRLDNTRSSNRAGKRPREPHGRAGCSRASSAPTAARAAEEGATPAEPVQGRWAAGSGTPWA